MMLTLRAIRASIPRVGTRSTCYNYENTIEDNVMISFSSDLTGRPANFVGPSSFKDQSCGADLVLTILLNESVYELH